MNEIGIVLFPWTKLHRLEYPLVLLMRLEIREFPRIHQRIFPQLCPHRFALLAKSLQHIILSIISPLRVLVDILSLEILC